MHTILSTATEHPRNSFRRWREAIHARIVPVELTRPDDAPFAATLEAAEVGGLALSRITQTAMRTEATPETIRRHGKHDTVSVVIVIDGVVKSIQDDRVAVQKAGEIVVLERRPTVMVTEARSRTLYVEVPRARLTGVLGPPRLYSALTMAADQASTNLAATFLGELVKVHSRLAPDTAERMAGVGMDLLAACIADRLARDVPMSLHGTIVLQRAKAYVETHLGDPTLDPPGLAAAVGVSLRRLQQLFHEHGRSVSDWIRSRRLEVAARRLADPLHGHMSIDAIAYGCGFLSQAHFSRRFKDRYGMTPSDYRRNHR